MTDVLQYGTNGKNDNKYTGADRANAFPKASVLPCVRYLKHLGCEISDIMMYIFLLRVGVLPLSFMQW